MRNDAHDELENVPSLTTGPRDRDEYSAPAHHEAEPRRDAGKKTAVRSGGGTGALWALVFALLIALGGLGWWSFQQISMMEAQLVATQESFARISEEAAGRIQDISGKVVAAESSVTTDSEALKLRLKQLETKLAELTRQQQGLSSQHGDQGKRLEQLSAELKAQQGAVAKQLDSFGTAQKSVQDGVGKLEGQLKGLDGDVAALKKRQDPSKAIDGLQQDLLVLRSELDNRPQPRDNTAEFDAFRAQMTRNINTLSAQVQNLQQQLSARP